MRSGGLFFYDHFCKQHTAERIQELFSKPDVTSELGQWIPQKAFDAKATMEDVIHVGE